MSNSLAIATVTATLQHYLQAILNSEFGGAVVKIGQPKAPSPEPDPEVNISLYHAAPNTAYRNFDTPTRDSSGMRLLTEPRIALDLYYILSFYGEEQNFEPQRLLGIVARALHVQTVFTPAMITQAKIAYDLVGNSDLDTNNIEQIKFVMQSVPVDEITKIWGAFFHEISYSLSVLYTASLVVIDSGIAVTSNPAPSEISINTLSGVLPRNKAQAINFTNLASNGFIEGNLEIVRAANEGDITQYVLYWGSSATTKLSNQPAITYLAKTGSNLNYPFATGTVVPVGAFYLLVFTRNQHGEMLTGISNIIHESD